MDLIDNEEVPFMYDQAAVSASLSCIQYLVITTLPELMWRRPKILRRKSGVIVTQGWSEQLSASNHAVIV